MKTKKLLATLFALMMAFSLAAQGPAKGQCKKSKTPEEKAQRQSEWMKRDLGLTEKQAAEIEKINLTYAIEAEKMRQEMKEKRKVQVDNKNAELKKVLTPEQYTKLEQIRAEKKEQRKHKKQQMRRCMQESTTNQPK
jgi:Spy/CpxP family protein refolding chaperone